MTGNAYPFPSATTLWCHQEEVQDTVPVVRGQRCVDVHAEGAWAWGRVNKITPGGTRILVYRTCIVGGFVCFYLGVFNNTKRINKRRRPVTVIVGLVR